ncbi:type 1 glutamine amidotransferase domain-containing protein [Streptococcus cuniculipharyngis]|uniref:Type 1 glutamine amidotransferase domain-containing protein n=1 Tax=Streptococcus cuniculipharyngis TaxID=1562651 RepID=A0A5C5SAK5_9STRE|nr:type 1 glutamine amidotransferase domain-containing protein [Streptococcus cuniculipharyngis]TWS96283.1 type 1 glutamine amidotransferase domain-containing protein [Streptococcus cuniculipharyngis]
MGLKQGKVLVVLTNVSSYGEDSEATGLWLAEATEFVDELIKAGYELDYVSPKGGQVPLDPRSLKKVYAKQGDFAIKNSQDFQVRALKHSKKPSEVNPADYVALYYTGGHGVIWDFPDDEGLQALAMSIYRQGGYLISVCHGVAGLLNLKDEEGSYLIAGKRITGFTKWEEILSGKLGKVPFVTENAVKQRGADFQKKRPFASHALRDGRLITGQNPMSGRAVAKLLVESLATEVN